MGAALTGVIGIERQPQVAAIGVEVIVVSEPTAWPPTKSPWCVSGVLFRERGLQPRMHDRWPKRWCSDPATSLTLEWNYLAERLNEGRGGNGYAYELRAFGVGNVRDIEVLVGEYADYLSLWEFGPFGDGAGRWNPCAPPFGLTRIGNSASAAS